MKRYSYLTFLLVAGILIPLLGLWLSRTTPYYEEGLPADLNQVAMANYVEDTYIECRYHNKLLATLLALLSRGYTLAQLYEVTSMRNLAASPWRAIEGENGDIVGISLTRFSEYTIDRWPESFALCTDDRKALLSAIAKVDLSSWTKASILRELRDHGVPYSDYSDCVIGVGDGPGVVELRFEDDKLAEVGFFIDDCPR